MSPNKALAVLGGFDASVGNFDVSGSVTAYFANVAAVAAVRNNSDVGLNVIAANDNRGFVFDMPLVSLGGGRLADEKDSPINIQLDATPLNVRQGTHCQRPILAIFPMLGWPTPEATTAQGSTLGLFLTKRGKACRLKANLEP